MRNLFKNPLKNPRHLPHSKNTAMTIGALGVVFGDIGTSPLYAINEIFFGPAHVSRTPEAILGCMSLVFWTLTLIICVKYLSFVLLADNEGEGGVFALYSRIHKFKNGPIALLKIILMLAAGLLFGEGIITPAISVLSAVEGVALITPVFEKWIVPLTVLILFGLFFIQKRGTHSMGKYFGPIALVWFIVIGSLGFYSLMQNFEVLHAINPYYAIKFISSCQASQILIILGSIMLVITGGEALFADMGHFHLGAIRGGWYIFVYPALLLNYLGQGAHLLSEKSVQKGNVFYSMVPSSVLIPLVVLATIATIIASQALISGAFSLTSQAIALGLFPRLKTVHTHADHAGQLYLPFINWALFLGTITLVIGFQTSNHLAAAYGLSVSGVMFSTSLAMFVISLEYWKWPKWRAFIIFGSFALIDGVFLTSNSFKFLSGGFIPLIIGFLIFSIMRIWRWGRKATYRAYSEILTPTLEELVRLKSESKESILRNVVLMVPKPLRSLNDNVPALVQFFINRYSILPKNLFLVEVVHRKVPYVFDQRFEYYTFYTDPDKGTIVSVTIHFGFMEDPNVEWVLEELAHEHKIDLPSDPDKWLVHVSHERLIGANSWNWFRNVRLRLFLFFRQITQPAYFYYGLGNKVNLSLDIMPVRLK